jgi:hypothetical protein
MNDSALSFRRWAVMFAAGFSGVIDLISMLFDRHPTPTVASSSRHMHERRCANPRDPLRLCPVCSRRLCDGQAGTPADAWIANLVVCMSTGAHSEDQAARRVWLTEEQAPERGRAAVHERDHFYSF